MKYSNSLRRKSILLHSVGSQEDCLGIQRRPHHTLAHLDSLLPYTRRLLQYFQHLECPHQQLIFSEEG